MDRQRDNSFNLSMYEEKEPVSPTSPREQSSLADSKVIADPKDMKKEIEIKQGFLLF